MRDSKIKKLMQSLLGRAKNALARCKNLQNIDPEIVESLKGEAEQMQQEMDNATVEDDVADSINQSIRVGEDSSEHTID